MENLKWQNSSYMHTDLRMAAYITIKYQGVNNDSNIVLITYVRYVLEESLLKMNIKCLNI